MAVLITGALYLLACCRGRLFPSKPWLWRCPSIPRSHIQDWHGSASPRLLSQRGLRCRHRDRRHHVAGACGQIMGPQQHQVRPQLMPLQQGKLQSYSHWHWTREHRKRYGTFLFYFFLSPYQESWFYNVSFSMWIWFWFRNRFVLIFQRMFLYIHAVWHAISLRQHQTQAGLFCILQTKWWLCWFGFV